MANWIIQFAARYGQEYKITIAGAPGNQDVNLTPAQEPLTTQEEGSEDLFNGIQVQTGYISVITDDVTFVRTIIPNKGGERTVAIQKKDQSTWVLVWKGYVQPKMLSMQIWMGNQKVQIPIECPLSALKYKTYNIATGFRKICDVINDIMGSIFDSFIFQGRAICSDNQLYTTKLWMMKTINTEMLNGRSTFDVINDICSLIGWNCRSMGNVVYFIAFRNIDSALGRTLCNLNANQLVFIDETPATTTQWTDTYLPTDSIANTHTKIKIIEGLKTFTAKSDLEPFYTDIKPDIDDFKLAVYNSDWNPQHVVIEEPSQTYEDATHYNDYWQSYSSVNIDGFEINGYNSYGNLTNTGESDIAKWPFGFRIRVTENYETNDLDQDDPDYYFHHISWNYGWMLFTSHNSYSFVDGTIRLEFSIDDSVLNHLDRAGVYIYVGNKRFDPNNGQWISASTQKGQDFMTLAQDNRGKLFVEIPTPSEGISGTVGIELRTDDDCSTVRPYNGLQVKFENLTFTFKPKENDNVDSNMTEINHTYNNGDGFTKEKNFNSTFCLKEYLIQMCKNFIFDSENVPTEAFYMETSGNYTFNPLDLTAKEGAAESDQNGELFEIDVLEHKMLAAITPATKMYIEWFDGDYYPVSISRKWVEGIIVLKLLRRRNISAS